MLNHNHIKRCSTGEISELKVHCNSENSYLILCSESTEAEVMVKITYAKRNYIIKPGEGLPIEVDWNAGMGKKSLVRIDNNNIYFMTARQLQISVANNASLYYIMCKTPINACDGLSNEDHQFSNQAAQDFENYQPDFEGVDPEFICSETSYSLYGSKHNEKKTKRSYKIMTNSNRKEDIPLSFEDDENMIAGDLEMWLEGSGFSIDNDDVDPIAIPITGDLKDHPGPQVLKAAKGHIEEFTVNEDNQDIGNAMLDLEDGSGYDDDTPSDLALLEGSGSGASYSPQESCTTGEISKLQLQNNSETSYLTLCSESAQAEIEIRITSEGKVIASKSEGKYSIGPDISLPIKIKWNKDIPNKVSIKEYEYFMTAQQLKVTVTNNVAVYYIMCSRFHVMQCDAVPYQPDKRVEDTRDSHQSSSYTSMLGLLLGGLFGTLLLVTIYVALIKCFYRRKKEFGAILEKKSNSECGDTSIMKSVDI